MPTGDQCAAIIPCLNEARSIASLVEAVGHYVALVIVVDDGSTDGTEDVARQAGAEVLRHDRPLGKGAALRDGCRQALRRGLEWGLCLDGDGQHAPADIPRFLAAAGEGTRLVVGNRMSSCAGMPWIRRWTNRFMSWRLSRLAGQPLPDTQCGFRLVHLPTWAGLDLKADHFEVDSEWLLAFARAGCRIGFVPIRVIYGEERSKIHPLRDTLRWWRWLRGWRR